MTQLICRVVIGVGGCWAAYLNASEPLIWAPSPALALRAEPISVVSAVPASIRGAETAR
jgi:hypothetical protein